MNYRTVFNSYYKVKNNLDFLMENQKKYIQKKEVIEGVIDEF